MGFMCQEMYNSLINNFYRNTSLAMMVYSIDSRESFEHINIWLKEIKIYSHPDVIIILIGNKSDLEEERKVTYEEAKKFKEENKLLYFEETSAKNGINSKEIFYESAKILFKEHLKYSSMAQNNNSNDNFSVNSNSNALTKLKRVNSKRNNNCC